jgi:hypothetical protein
MPICLADRIRPGNRHISLPNKFEQASLPGQSTWHVNSNISKVIRKSLSTGLKKFLSGALIFAISTVSYSKAGAQLSDQFNMEINKAKHMPGLVARVCAELASHTVGIYLNYLPGRPSPQSQRLVTLHQIFVR